MRRRGRRGRRSAAGRATGLLLRGLVVAAMIMALVPATLVAHEHHDPNWNPGEIGEDEQVVDDDEPEEDLGDFVRLSHTIPIEPVFDHLNRQVDQMGAGDYLWTWPEGRRGFMLAEPFGVSGNVNPHANGFEALVAVDLDTGEEVGRVELDPPGWSGGNTRKSGATHQGGSGHPHTIAVDREGGRLFVAYGIPNWGAGIGADTRHVDRLVEDQELCPSVSGFGVGVSYDNVANCLKGIHVVDMDSLEIIDDIPLDVQRIDGHTNGTLALRAMTYAPPRHAGENGKLHLVVTERANQFFWMAWATMGRFETDGYPSPRFAVQVDVDEGRMDWATPLRDCRTTEDTSDDPQVRGNSADQPYAFAIMRGADPDDPSVWVACPGRNRQAIIVRVPLNPDGSVEMLPVRTDLPNRALGMLTGGGDLGPDDVASPRSQAFAGPPDVIQYLVHPESGRIVMHSMIGGEVWWVFDTLRREFVGTIGIGDFNGVRWTEAGMDPVSGRLYVLTPPPFGGQTEGGGMFVAEAAQTPVPQALHFPELVDLRPRSYTNRALSVEPGDGERPARIYVHRGDHFVVLEDQIIHRDAPSREIGGESLDVDEVEGVTSRSVDGAAQGYGARAIFVGGLEAAARFGPVDPGWHYNIPAAGNPIDPHDCSQRTRDVTVGFVGPGGPVIVDDGGSRAGAIPLMVDAGTREDPGEPYSRCAITSQRGEDLVGDDFPDTSTWENLWESMGLFGSPPLDEPGVEWPFDDGSTGCVSSDEEPSERGSGGPGGQWESEVECQEEESGGFSRARTIGAEGVLVAEVWAAFDIYRDPVRGLVSRMESMARGVTLAGPGGGPAVKIDTVKAVAESWANGRRQPAEVLADEADPDYDPNCDRRRSAGTCFERHLLGATIFGPDGSEEYSCGPCGDEDAFVDGMNDALGDYATVHFRYPDPLYARGAANGSQAAIQKPSDTAATDATMNRDLLANVVPALEIVRYAPFTRTQVTSNMPGPDPMRGHQLYQIAGVHVGTGYEIQCLLVIHEDGSCGPPLLEPGSVQFELMDHEGAPLAGGLFELYADADDDGLIGLSDVLAGSCVTGPDGTCVVEKLLPGPYVARQAAAPDGYLRDNESISLFLAEGEAWVVQVVNVVNSATIEISLADAFDDTPLEGGTFEAWMLEAAPDPDDDQDEGAGLLGTLDLNGPAGVKAGECTTGADGVCTMAAVPLGSYAVRQTGAPEGYEPAEAVRFDLFQPAQVARVSVFNAPPGGIAPPADVVEDAAPPITTTSPVAAPAPSVSTSQPVGVFDPPPLAAGAAPPPAAPASPGTMLAQLPQQALQLALRDPLQAAAYGGIWLLLLAAAAAVRRRSLLAEMLAQ